MLRPGDYDAINAQIHKHLSKIRDRNIRVERSMDMDAFRATRESLGRPPTNALHPGLDPHHSVIADGDGQWLCLTDDATGDVIATTGCRLMRDTTVAHLLHARLIWRERQHPIDRIEPCRYDMDPALYQIAGKLVFGGGAYLDRRYKNHGIGQSMAAVMHALCMRLWCPDYFFNMMVVEKLDSPVNPKRFGYRHTAVAFDPQTRPDWGPKNPCEIVNWKSRDEELASYTEQQQQAA